MSLIRRKVLTTMHARMSTFIVTTSNPIGQESKTTKKDKVQGAFCLIF